MSILITGAAGFIGANLIRRLLPLGMPIFGVDNLSNGSVCNISDAIKEGRFTFIQADVSDSAALTSALADVKGVTEVWHLAANSDIPKGIADPRIDFRDTFATTFNILQWMAQERVPRLFFASTSAVYGDHGTNVLSEATGPLLPLSNYGAMKLASEAQISAATESKLQQSVIFRFPNVVGTPATHGVILDFVRRLKANADQLDVLGDGTQQKAYLHVDELVDAMLHVRELPSLGRRSIFNVGPENDGGVTVKAIATQVVEKVAPSANICYGAGNKGWVGDVPRFIYSVERLKAHGWQPQLSSAEAIRKAICEIVDQEVRKQKT